MNPIYLFFAQGSEEVEALAVVDIVRRAELPIQIVSVTGQKMMEGAHGIKIEADVLFEEADLENASLFVLPGGLPGSYNLADHEGLRQAILKRAEAGGLMAAICAAPLVYGRLGLLKGLKATCYPGFDQELEGAQYTGKFVEQDGLFITGKGPAAVFEFAYTIVERLGGADKAEALKAGMLYTELK